jgi:hypothetical protein
MMAVSCDGLMVVCNCRDGRVRLGSLVGHPSPVGGEYYNDRVWCFDSSGGGSRDCHQPDYG